VAALIMPNLVLSVAAKVIVMNIPIATVMNTVTTMSTLTVTAMTMSTVMITVTNIAMS
jgi:hypothetical protein